MSSLKSFKKIGRVFLGLFTWNHPDILNIPEFPKGVKKIVIHAVNIYRYRLKVQGTGKGYRVQGTGYSLIGEICKLFCYLTKPHQLLLFLQPNATTSVIAILLWWERAIYRPSNSVSIWLWWQWVICWVFNPNGFLIGITDFVIIIKQFPNCNRLQTPILLCFYMALSIPKELI